MNRKDYQHAYALAVTAGETAAMAALLAKYYVDMLKRWQQDQLTSQYPSAITHEESKPYALENSWHYLESLKERLAKGHSVVWADALQRHLILGSIEAQKAAYEAVRKKSPYDIFEGRNHAVYSEAYVACASKGPVFAAAYATWVAEGDLENAYQYATVLTQQLEDGCSALYAHEYAVSIIEGQDRKYAALETRIFEQAMLGGMLEKHARLYADKLAGDLFDGPDTKKFVAFHTQDADKYIADVQRKEEARNRGKQRTGGNGASREAS